MPKLSLRDLFAVVTVAAMALGWWLEHRAKVAALQNLQAERARRIGVEENADILHLMWAEERARNRFLQRDLDRDSTSEQQAPSGQH